MERAVLSGDPYPKSSQLARGERRYRRKVASPKQWQTILAAKRGPCRVCRAPQDGSRAYPLSLHHIVPRDMHGDDIADNICPLCFDCHDDVERRASLALRLLAESLTDAEYAYVIGTLGEGGMERLFGVGRA